MISFAHVPGIHRAASRTALAAMLLLGPSTAALAPALARVDDGLGHDGAVALDHAEQAGLLGAYGVELIDREVVGDPDAAVAAAVRLGWPVALKHA